MRVFLGGTWNFSNWRNILIPMLDKYGIEYFNPIVPEWTEDAFQKELDEKRKCDCYLYVITPRMSGSYAIAEAVDDSNKIPFRTIFCIKKNDNGETFLDNQLRSLEKVGLMIQKNGGTYVNDWSNLLNTLIKFRDKTL